MFEGGEDTLRRSSLSLSLSSRPSRPSRRERGSYRSTGPGDRERLRSLRSLPVHIISRCTVPEYCVATDQSPMPWIDRTWRAPTAVEVIRAIVPSPRFIAAPSPFRRRPRSRVPVRVIRVHFQMAPCHQATSISLVGLATTMQLR